MKTEMEFMEEVMGGLEKRMEGEYQVKPGPVAKNNGAVLAGVILKKKEENQGVTVCLGPYYGAYQDGKIGLEGVIEDIYGLFAGNQEYACLPDREVFGSPEVWDKVIFRLVNREKNQEFLKKIPHILFLDLAVVFMLVLDQNERGQMSVLVNNEAMKGWGGDVEGLFARARENAPLLYPASLVSMEEAIKEMIGGSMGEGCTGELIPGCMEAGSIGMYVLTNQRGFHGAAALLYPDIVKDFADSQGCDLVILPSSVHEVLLVPEREPMDYTYMRDMVKNVNSTEVALEDQLSDEVYVYRREEGRIVIAE